jgi:hypothetical protein
LNKRKRKNKPTTYKSRQKASYKRSAPERR